ncbi:MAG: 3-deoxy-D-manno-octulosonic acid transferase [Betaproteobacteria bacterium]|nr:3-deoxy-D-manno-octulosonic acid transferase [Betaproteobacteria bacterium]
MNRFTYTLLLRLALPFVLARLWWRGRRESGYRRGIAERLGVYAIERPEKLLWVHAVSVGEVRASAPLVRALQEAAPDHKMLMTCTTAAGRETIQQVYGDSVLASYLPYDYPGAARRFLEYFRPRLGVLMETEIWPNLLAECRAASVPVLLANARMSEKSAAGYTRWPDLMRPAFASLAAVCAQSADDAGRLRQLGAPSPEITGNLKFDATPDAAQVAAGEQWRQALGRAVVLLASTRESEERMLLEDFKELDALIVVVPRHPQRFEEVAALAGERRTAQAMPSAQTRVYLGDTMGEMAFYYGACDVAVIGGSFAALGGQNLIEALACGAAVVTGPSMFNFAEATRLAVEAGAALQCAGPEAAASATRDLLADPQRRQAMSRAGKALCEAHRGATERHMKVCLRLLRERARG